MTYEEVYERLTNTNFFSKSAGLYRMKTMLRYFDNPQDSVPCIHVAGTNGKGSVCAILASVLRQAGYHVGLFTSPYLINFRERIQYDGAMISEEDCAKYGTIVCEYSDKLYEPANQFELLTALAMLYFRDKKCDIVILETGLGGTFDPTNTVSKPLCSVIMNIGLDHCAILGNTIEQIAAAKSGIIKPDCDVCVYPVTPDAYKVISEYAWKANAALHSVDADDVTELEPIAGLEHFAYKDHEYTLSLLGKHQQYNAATALEVLTVLNRHGFYVSDEEIQNGFRTVNWPARLEILSKRPLVYLDGGHNPQCVAAITKWFRTEAFHGKNITVVTGMVNDKDYRTMLEMLRTISDTIYFYRFDNKRAIPSEEVDRLCMEFSMKRIDSLQETVNEILKNAKKNDVFLFIGSLYMVQDVKEAMKRYRIEKKGNKHE